MDVDLSTWPVEELHHIANDLLDPDAKTTLLAGALYDLSDSPTIVSVSVYNPEEPNQHVVLKRLLFGKNLRPNTKRN